MKVRSSLIILASCADCVGPAVILNEHLTEALRRLKKDSNENSVDRYAPCLLPSIAHH